MKKNTWVAASAVAVSGALAITACSGATAEDDVTIRFVGTQPPDLIQPTLDAFHEHQDGITVEYESVPFENLSATIAQRVGGDTGDIDVYFADAPRNPSIIEAGYTLELTEEVGELDGLVSQSGIETATDSEGRLWTLPMRTSTQVLYYNIDLLEEAGIEAPSMDPDERITWETLKDLAIQAQDAGAEWGYVDDQVSRYYQFQPLPESKGGGSGLTGDENLTPALTEPGFVEAAEYWQSLYSDGIAPRGIDPDQTKPVFQNGEAAFMPGGPWWITDFAENEDLNFGVAAYPMFEGGEAVTPTDSEHLAVASTTDHPEAAIEFAEWVTLTKEGALAMSSGLGVPTANLEAQPTHLAELEDARPSLEGFADLATWEFENTAVPRPDSVGYVQFEDTMAQVLEDIRNGSDVNDRLSQGNSELDQAFGRL